MQKNEIRHPQVIPFPISHSFQTLVHVKANVSFNVRKLKVKNDHLLQVEVDTKKCRVM